MSRSRTQTMLAAALLAALAAAPARAGHGELHTLESAAETIRNQPADPLACIPPVVVSDARAVVIVPHVVKVGFLADARYGKGVLLTRRPNGSWSDPTFVVLAGGGFGLQAGIQSTDVVLVFRTAQGLE